MSSENSERTQVRRTLNSRWLARAKGIQPTVFAYATILVAFFLRVYRLGDQNVWWDEGWSLWLAKKDWLWIAWRTAADEHPPLHYWMLNVWDGMAGWSAYAGRFLSLFFGVLTVALIFRIGRKAGGLWVGVLAAFFLATARFHIWWSQDIKNYTPSVFFAFAALWFALILLEKPRRWAVLGYAVCAALALWTHYLAVLVLIGLNLYALIFFSRRVHTICSRQIEQQARFTHGESSSKQQVAGGVYAWMAANLLGALLFIPWLWIYLANAAEWNAAPTFDPGLFVKLVATVLPLGVTTNIDRYAALTIFLTALAILGLTARKTSRHLFLFGLVVLFPPLLIYLISLTPVAFFAPKVQARYLLILVPAYAVLLAFGVEMLRRFSTWLAVCAFILVGIVSGMVLNDYYAGRRLQDEYATLANMINSFAEPSDLVLLDTDQEWPTFLYYLRPPLEWQGVPNGQTMGAANADVLVRRARMRHDTVWLVTLPDALATDPQHLVEARLARELGKQFEQTFDDKRLVLYAANARNLASVPLANFAPQYVHAETVSTAVELLGFDLPVREARVGDTLRLVTYWNAAQASDVSVGFQGMAGAVRVPPGERVRVETDFVIPANAPSAVRIQVGDQSLPTGCCAPSDRSIAQVRVEPRGTFAVGATGHPVDYKLGEAIRLIGYDLGGRTFRAGSSVPITLYWRADHAVEKKYTVFVHLLGEEFNTAQGNFLWGQVDRVPREGTMPTTAWAPGQNVPDEYQVPVDARAPAGRYRIEIGLYDPANGIRLIASDGRDSIIVDEIEIR